MNQSIKLNRIKSLSRMIFFLVPIFFIGTPSAYSQMNQIHGTNNAIDLISGQRDPFWPVGFVPESEIQKEVSTQKKITGSVDWNKAMKQISIQGVSSRAGNEFFTIINGQIKRSGETISVKVSDVLYTWKIESIAPPRSVKLRRISAQ